MRLFVFVIVLSLIGCSSVDQYGWTTISHQEREFVVDQYYFFSFGNGISGHYEEVTKYEYIPCEKAREFGIAVSRDCYNYHGITQEMIGQARKDVLEMNKYRIHK